LWGSIEWSFYQNEMQSSFMEEEPSPLLAVLLTPKEDYGQSALQHKMFDAWFQSQGNYGILPLDGTSKNPNITAIQHASEMVVNITEQLRHCPHAIIWIKDMQLNNARHIYNDIHDTRSFKPKNGVLPVDGRHAVFVLQIEDEKNLLQEFLLEDRVKNINSDLELVYYIETEIGPLLRKHYLRDWKGVESRVTIFPIWILSQETKAKFAEYNFAQHISKMCHWSVDHVQIAAMVNTMSPPGTGISPIDIGAINSYIKDIDCSCLSQNKQLIWQPSPKLNQFVLIC